MLFLGIDGGGTKTLFVLYDGNGQELAITSTDSASYWQKSSHILAEIIRVGVARVLDAAEKCFEQITAVGFGMAGFGESPKKDIETKAVCLELFRDVPTGICNDVEIGYIASLALEPGINVVAGTGSIAFGKDKNGKSARCGGWDCQIGDEGSGYWLGMKTLELFTKQSDGRLEKSTIYELIKDRFRLKDDFEIIDVFLNQYSQNRAKVASIQKVLYQAAKGGDQQAINMYRIAANELVALPVAINNRLNFEDAVNVSYSGGMFEVGEFIVNPFISSLEKLGFNVFKPIFPPKIGSIIFAAQQVSIAKELIQNLKKSWRVECQN